MEQNEGSKKPDNVRSPGVTDRDFLISEQPQDQAEVVRKPVVPDLTNNPEKSDEFRSPGVTDRNIFLEEITANTNEETETVRRLIVPEEIESEDGSSSTNQ